MPGVALANSFFAEQRSVQAIYPGWPGDPGLFADFVFLDFAGTTLASYTLPAASGVQPALRALNHVENSAPGSTNQMHAMFSWVTSGAEWTSPWVRIRVGQGLDQVVASFRADTGMQDFDSLGDKLGPLLETLARAPLVNADFDWIDKPLSEFEAVFDRIPSPALFHPVAWQPGGFFGDHPDLLATRAKWGTTEQLRAMFERAKELGHLVMPYTNPTWWNVDSPTLTDLAPPLTANDLAVHDPLGAPEFANYGGTVGLVVSPHHDFVTDRLARLMTEMTVDLPSDFVFDDQIGARAWRYDFNPSAPNPMAYIDGWLEHTRNHRGVGLMTEQGFDVLVETELGFHGSMLLPEFVEDEKNLLLARPGQLGRRSPVPDDGAGQGAVLPARSRPLDVYQESGAPAVERDHGIHGERRRAAIGGGRDVPSRHCDAAARGLIPLRD